MPCPIVMEFDWKAVWMGQTYTGRGLLSKGLHPFRDRLDEFTVAIGDLIVSAFPKKAELHIDFNKVTACDCGKPHKLLWFRTMRQDLGTETNSSPPYCELYGIGFECERGRIGWSFLPDGTAQRGIE